LKNPNLIADSTKSLQLLYELSEQLASALDLQTTIEQVMALSAQYIGAERGSLVVLDVDQAPLDAVLIYEGRMQFNNAAQFADVVKRGLIAWVIEHREAAFINDTSQDDRWLKRQDDSPEQTGAKSAMCIPLEARGQLVGVLTTVQPQPNRFTQAEFDFLKAVADQAGVAIHNALLFDSLESMHRQYFELFEDNIASIIMTDPEGKITKANRAAYALMERIGRELVGTYISDFHHIPVNLVGHQFDKLYGGDVVTYDSVLEFLHGSTMPVKVSVRMLPRDIKGSIQWIFEDISSQKELETMRHDLLSMVYHDIRSPLANVISSLELLRVMVPVEEDQNVEDVFSVISRSSNRIQRLVSNLLDIDRLETGQAIVNARMVDLNVLVDVVTEDVAPLIESRDQHFTLQMDEGVDEVWADEDMLRRVLINLLENASKYTPVGGDVQFSIVREADGMLRFLIADTGSGIPSDMILTIFDKFTRVNPNRGPKGIGLGLAFCRLAVEAHDGRIWVESEEGKGSQFIFELPYNDGTMLHSDV
jgi:PAS domain S-box-containing protein